MDNFKTYYFEIHPTADIYCKNFMDELQLKYTVDILYDKMLMIGVRCNQHTKIQLEKCFGPLEEECVVDLIV